MTDERTFGLALYNPQQAHAALAGQVWPHMKGELQASRRLWLSVQPLEDARSLQQNKFYWGVVLRQISEQAQVEGIGANADGWHLYFKKMFLGYQFTKVKEPGKKRKTVKRELRSTTDLSVRQFAEYIERIQAHAATVFGVTFTELLPQELKPEPRKAKPKAGTVIDMDTGEILEEATA